MTQVVTVVDLQISDRGLGGWEVGVATNMKSKLPLVAPILFITTLPKEGGPLGPPPTFPLDLLVGNSSFEHLLDWAHLWVGAVTIIISIN